MVYPPGFVLPALLAAHGASVGHVAVDNYATAAAGDAAAHDAAHPDHAARSVAAVGRASETTQVSNEPSACLPAHRHPGRRSHRSYC